MIYEFCSVLFFSRPRSEVEVAHYKQHVHLGDLFNCLRQVSTTTAALNIITLPASIAESGKQVTASRRVQRTCLGLSCMFLCVGPNYRGC